jgi:integrase
MEETLDEQKLKLAVHKVAKEFGFYPEQEALLYDQMLSRSKKEPITYSKIVYGATKLFPPISEEELRTFLKANEPDIKYRLFFLLLYYGALRTGEALGLKKKDIELREDGALIHVQRQRTDSEKRGDWRVASPLKSKNSYRSVPIPLEFAKILLSLNEEPLGDDTFLFTFSPSDVRHRWLRLVRKSGKSYGTLHFLRRSRITYWTTKMTSYEVSQISGNTISVVERYYKISGTLLNAEEIMKKAV